MKYDDAIGVKTGFTSQAGYCLIAGARRDGTELIAVVLQTDSSNVYLDAISLLEYGFSGYKTVLAVQNGEAADAVRVKSGAVNKVETRVDGDGWVTLPSDASWSDLEKAAEMVEALEAPVEKGVTAGSMAVSYKGDVLCTLNIVADGDVAKGGFLSFFGVEDRTANAIRNVILVVVAFLTLLLICYMLLKRRQVRRRRQRRAERAARYADEAERIKDVRRM
jgi:D-alanyl-D-alanine carboxypeptidase (penicillin-binding protein 5/6)